ncbi:HisA/HisF-related TIM barrel protein [Prochlorococcus marinus]|uniref:Imidazole glycerol phosphate synthase cyclase subunit n=2 Tax=Prochlorococcaceae TaxID=2881426 RepID=A3PE78_PROM0|nr:Hypothetical protein P9301_14301 [Prochlorococcus marinus str. MIT 9301]
MIKTFGFSNIANCSDEILIINLSEKNWEEAYNNKFFNDISLLLSKTFLPITIGGKIRSIENAKELFNFGADKILISRAFFQDQNLLKEIRDLYGVQSIVVQFDINSQNYDIFINSSLEKVSNLKKIVYSLNEKNLMGELIINQIDRDGTGFGHNTEYLNAIPKLNMPLIASGGFGSSIHMAECLKFDSISAVATSNLLNFIGDAFSEARQELRKMNFELTPW